MRKAIILLILILSCLVLKAQTKAPVKKDTTKVKYNYFVVVPVNDYQQMAGALNEYKRLIMYDPASNGDQKVKMFQGIEQYLKDLPTRIKIDSVKKK